MKKRATILLLNILLLTAISGGLFAQASRTEWELDKKLTWNDFTRIRDNGSGYSASVYWELSFDMEWAVNEPVFEVDVFAVKSKSWVKRGRETNKLLAHEQLHFDIAELYARKLRREFARWRPGGRSPNAIFNRIMKECNAFQDQYDHETDHGTIPAEQARWVKKVNEAMRDMYAWRKR